MESVAKYDSTFTIYVYFGYFACWISVEGRCLEDADTSASQSREAQREGINERLQHASILFFHPFPLHFLYHSSDRKSRDLLKLYSRPVGAP
jgi:hypothetical protein